MQLYSHLSELLKIQQQGNACLHGIKTISLLLCMCVNFPLGSKKYLSTF